jgi:hypothetical protein
MAKEPYVKFYVEIPKSRTRTVWEVMEGVGRNMKLLEIMEEPAPVQHGPNGPFSHVSVTHHRHQSRSGEIAQWAIQFWSGFEPIFKLDSPKFMRHNDQRLKEVVTARGYKPDNMSAIWTTLVRAGYCIRVSRGLYCLPVDAPPHLRPERQNL